MPEQTPEQTTLDEPKQFGVEETKDLVIFIAAAITATLKAAGDGLTVGDLAALMPLLDEGAKAFKGIGNVPAELRNLNSAELTELTELVSERLTIPNKKVRRIVPAVLSMAPGIFAVIQAIKAK